jgi:hypothetical protein
VGVIHIGCAADHLGHEPRRYSRAIRSPPGLSQNEMIADSPALRAPPAALGERDGGMWLKLQALPKTVAGETDQTEPADDDEILQHGYCGHRELRSGSNHEGRNSPQQPIAKVQSAKPQRLPVKWLVKGVLSTKAKPSAARTTSCSCPLQ